MSRGFPTLLAHDLAVAFKNKTIFLIVCIPLFVYGTLMLVDGADDPAAAVRIGLLKTERYDAALRHHLASAPESFSIREVADPEEGTRLLKEREIDGLVSGANDDPSRVVVLVVKKSSPTTLALVQRFSALQIAVQGSGPGWVSAIRPLQSGTIEAQSLPTWILMVVLLVSFFVMPAQVAEEKEKQWLLGLLQTPMREGEWLAAKLAYGMILILVAVLSLHLLGHVSRVPGTYLAMLGAGGFCFCAMGILLGLLCRSQASARTMGVICYLPLLLPAALSDLSQGLRAVAPFLPSFAFFAPVQSILLEDTHAEAYPMEWLILVAMGAAACLLSHKLIKARWLM